MTSGGSGPQRRSFELAVSSSKCDKPPSQLPLFAVPPKYVHNLKCREKKIKVIHTILSRGSHICVDFVCMVRNLIFTSLLDKDATMTADSFKAIDVGYAVQRSFANKFFANKTIAKGLIDENSAQLLDELYKLAKIYVSENIPKFQLKRP